MVDRTPEQVKATSDHLRGTVAAELSAETPKFTHDAEVVLKFHGIYQQDDRDVRRERTSKKLPLEHICMVRASIPGGIVTAEQYLVMDRLADEFANGSMRITTRQGIQYHFTRKGDLRPLISMLNEHLVTTLAACGDVVRNTMCCPAPFASEQRTELRRRTDAIAERFRPRTGAYYELWVDGEKASSAEPASPGAGEQEPLYGTTYLPRKFKIGVAAPGDNCIDAYTQDVAAVPLIDSDTQAITAFTVLVGGGFGVSHADDTTYPRMGSPLTTVEPAELEDVIEAVIVVQRDHGERGDRKHARLKYLIDRWGLDRFRATVQGQLGRALPVAVEPDWQKVDDHLGWHEQGDGNWFLGVRVESGRVVDRDDIQLRSALREVVERFRPGIRFTPGQDVLLTGISAPDRLQVEAILRKARVPMAADIVPVVRHALACPALPTCGLALTEAERVLPEVVNSLHEAMSALGLGDEALTFRMTGCPNGCARPYSAEVGLTGRGKQSYDVMLGGNALGTRLTSTYAKNVKRNDVIPMLQPLLARWASERRDGEGFGDWCHRAGVEAATPA